MRNVLSTLLFGVAALATRAPVAHAETFNVPCSVTQLASVIATVNTNGQEDMVWLAPSCVYPLAATWVVEADGGNAVRVYGRAATISGQDARTAFLVNAGATLHLDDVKVKDGLTNANGGGIRNLGTLTLTGSAVTDNSAAGYGGGIHNEGTLKVIRSTISGNQGTSSGGGIRNQGTGRLTLTDSTVSGNTGLYGGGISNSRSATLFNSTLFGNGGFIGGGILNFNVGTALLSNVTISGNTISGSNGGGGLRNEGALQLDNSIIADHASVYADCSNTGTLTTLSGSLIEDGSCALIGLVTGDPKLGAPVGKPAYLPLLGGSPATDHAQNPNCPALDQRGMPRPQDGNQDGYAICDFGAFEGKPKGACGLLGIEAFLVLPLARRLARARTRRVAPSVLLPLGLPLGLGHRSEGSGAPSRATPWHQRRFGFSSAMARSTFENRLVV
jgi:hypothetical protein